MSYRRRRRAQNTGVFMEIIEFAMLLCFFFGMIIEGLVAFVKFSIWCIRGVVRFVNNYRAKREVLENV